MRKQLWIVGLLAILSVTACGDDEWPDGKPMVDDDGNEYATVKIDGRAWTAENLKYKTGVTCYTKDTDFYNKYGCLYNFDDAQKVCPDGWHVPSSNDYQSLLKYVDQNRTSSSVFKALIAKSALWQDYANKGGDDFGFAALPSGYLANYVTSDINVEYGDENYTIHGIKGYGDQGVVGAWWTSTVQSAFIFATGGDVFELKDGETSVYALAGRHGCAVRCMRD